MNRGEEVLGSDGTSLVVEVVWVDSAIQNGQVDRFEYPSPELIRSVGWLVADTEEHILLARDDHKDDEFRGLLSIPVECVRSRRTL